MYFINNLKLISRYLKNNIPLDKQILTECIEISNKSKTHLHLIDFINTISSIDNNFSQNISQIIKYFNPVLQIGLNLDAWLGGVEYDILDKKSNLQFFINFVVKKHNLIIEVNQILSQENYHTLQQELNLLLKDIIKMLNQQESVHYSNQFIKQFILL